LDDGTYLCKDFLQITNEILLQKSYNTSKYLLEVPKINIPSGPFFVNSEVDVLLIFDKIIEIPNYAWVF
jgi:hypothetical protein